MAHCMRVLHRHVSPKQKKNDNNKYAVIRVGPADGVESSPNTCYVIGTRRKIGVVCFVGW